VIVGLMFSCGKKEEVKQEIIRPVRYMQAYSTGGTRVRTFSGVTQAGLESNLSFRVHGTLHRIAVKVGDEVKPGELLAQLDPSDYELQVQQAEAALTSARAQARNADANYTRIRTLYENNSASKSELDGVRAASESATASVQSAEKQLELARLQLSYTTLEAPNGGDIARVNVEVNENVQAGQPVIMLTSGTQTEVRVSIPEVLIAQIREGEKVQVSCDAVPDKEFRATVLEVGVAATGIGTTFPVTVRFDERPEMIRPGMAANVSFLFESEDERERFIVPSHAVIEDRGGRFVFRVEPIRGEEGFGTIHRTSVTVGDLTAEGLEIFEGLRDGDLVITAGVSRITDGQKVRI
jgi:multidrug efflux system membrane fusion protein